VNKPTKTVFGPRWIHSPCSQSLLDISLKAHSNNGVLTLYSPTYARGGRRHQHGSPHLQLRDLCLDPHHGRPPRRGGPPSSRRRRRHSHPRRRRCLRPQQARRMKAETPPARPLAIAYRQLVSWIGVLDPARTCPVLVSSCSGPDRCPGLNASSPSCPGESKGRPRSRPASACPGLHHGRVPVSWGRPSCPALHWRP
jgi:hypothetical protein